MKKEINDIRKILIKTIKNTDLNKISLEKSIVISKLIKEYTRLLEVGENFEK